jgi:hypothetical protein
VSYDIAFQASVIPTIRALVSSALSTLFSGRVYWQLAPQEAQLPYCVFQSQDRGGRRDDDIGANGWVGLLTLRVLDDDQDDADALLAQLPALLQELSGLGRTFSLTPAQPLAIPPEQYPDRFIYTAALIGEAHLS